MKIQSFTFNPFQTNCYVCQDQGEAVIIDPGSSYDSEKEELLRYIEGEGVWVRSILLTHGHIDHIFGCAAMAEKFGVGISMHRSDVPLLEQAASQAEMFGVAIEEPPLPSYFLEEGDSVSFGGVHWDIIHTPGHSPGSICFIDKDQRCAFSGDVVFYDSIGRTDLWQSSLPTLMRSIYTKIMALDDDYTLYTGHGISTTVGRERNQNPFLVESPT